VAVTYTPFFDATKGIWSFLDKRLGSSALQPGFSVSFSQATASRPTDKSTIKVFYPKKQTVNGVDVVLAVGRVDKTFTVPGEFDSSDRANIAALSANLEDATIIRAIVKDRDPLY